MSETPQNQKIFIVTGKGGVGKSAVAAALAQQLASRGQKVLLVELGELSFYANYFATAVSYRTQNIFPGVDVAIWGGENCLREYLLHYLKIERIVSLFFENRVTKSLVNAAPALSEIAVMGKVTSGPRKIGPPMPYDAIVVDGYATGHLMALARAPKGLAEAIPFGPMGEQSRAIDRILRDPLRTQYVVVALPEELPVVETAELVQQLKNEFAQTPKVICNRVLSPPFSETEWKSLATHNLGSSKDFYDFIEASWRRQQSLLARLKDTIGDFSTIPHFLINDSRELVKEMSARLELL